jgi:hypothetical protein
MKDLSKNILAEIKQQEIKPIPRWRFILKNYGIWMAFGLLIILGSLSVSVIIFMFTDHDWNLYSYFNKSLWESILLAIPYFWFILMVGFLAFAYYDLRRTKSGYKLNFIKIGSINILASILLGALFFYSGLGLKIDQIFANNVPFYQSIHQFAGPRVWQNPENGLLVGEITNIENDGNFEIRDLNNQNWLVKCLNCLLNANIVNQQGMLVKLVGKISGNQIFDASELRPWKNNCERQPFGMFRKDCPPPMPITNVPPAAINILP